ncbi:MAG: SpoIIIAH-like family protein [Clostridiales bacterium]|jgi:stage III sporulation protein AH|nr:SpoIIIAH-like family protein [Clostridiales bacterium]
MKIKVKKMLVNKQVILALLVLVVVTAGIINWAGKGFESTMETGGIGVDISEEILNEQEKTTEANAAMDYFAQAINDRDIARGQVLEILENATDKEKAGEEITKIAKNMQNETTIEGLIKAKGFEKVVVYISDSGANVIVKAKGLTASQVAQIKDIIISQAGVSTDKIKIAEISGE